MLQRCCILILCSLVSFACFAEQPQKTITLATSQWEPYVIKSRKYHGHVYETVKAAFAHTDYQVKIEFMPWEDAVEAVKTGKVDGIFPEYSNKDSLDYLNLSESFDGGPIVIYKRRDSGIFYPFNPNDNSIDVAKVFDALKQYTFGAVEGYTNIAEFDKNFNLHKEFVKTDKENLQQLLDGKVQLIVIDKYIAQHILYNEFSQYHAKQLVELKPFLAEQQLYLGVSNKQSENLEILKAFNDGLLALRKNGQLSSLNVQESKYIKHEYA